MAFKSDDTKLAYVLSLLASLIQDSDFEQRLAALEEARDLPPRREVLSLNTTTEKLVKSVFSTRSKHEEAIRGSYSFAGLLGASNSDLLRSL